MLIGNYSQKFNAKGRTALPKKFRDELGDHLVLLQGYEKCLVLVPALSLNSLMQADRPFGLSAARETERFLLGNAFEIEFDDQGRFVVPAPLREFAQLDGEEIIFVGLGNRVEIWGPSQWKAYQEYLEENGAKIAESFMEFSKGNKK